MDNKAKLLRRLIALFCILVVLAGIALFALFRIQIVNGESYRTAAERKLTSTATVTASRGEIVDRYGRPLTTNKSVYSLRVDYVYWDRTNQNDTILALAKLVLASGGEPEDTLPITDEAPFEYLGEEGSSARKSLAGWLAEEELGADLTAGETVAALREHFAVDPSLSDEDARIIVGIRYQMSISDFSRFNSYIFAEDVSLDLISQVKERHQQFEGVEVEVRGLRQYETTYAAHLLGRVDIIYREEWPDYKEKGYSMKDVVGKEGLEKTLEEYLHGTNGTRTIEIDVSGNVTGEIEGKAPQPGDNCILTLDLALQKVAEDSLAATLQANEGTEGGAVVVLDVNSGEVLAMASYPTYNLATYKADYKENAANELSPFINRAIYSVYAPGSTFKVLMAIAALEEGVIDENFTVFCRRYYTFFETQTFSCLKYHGKMDVVHAIQESCNYFFYEVGRLMQGEKIEQWAAKYGLGQKTGIELEGERAGSVAGPTNRKKMQEKNPAITDWRWADSVQAAIGQSDNAYTPLQLANYMAAVVNGGTLYKPTLLKSVKTYDYSETVVDDEPEILGTIDVSPETTALVKEGMGRVISEGSAARAFNDCPVKVGGKSGTAQVGRNELANGLFIAFAPFDDPEIAICAVGEKIDSGSRMAPVVADIINAYFAGDSENDAVPAENTLLH